MGKLQRLKNRSAKDRLRKKIDKKYNQSMKPLEVGFCNGQRASKDLLTKTEIYQDNDGVVSDKAVTSGNLRPCHVAEAWQRHGVQHHSGVPNAGIPLPKRLLLVDGSGSPSTARTNIGLLSSKSKPDCRVETRTKDGSIDVNPTSAQRRFSNINGSRLACPFRSSAPGLGLTKPSNGHARQHLEGLMWFLAGQNSVACRSLKLTEGIVIFSASPERRASELTRQKLLGVFYPSKAHHSLPQITGSRPQMGNGYLVRIRNCQS